MKKDYYIALTGRKKNIGDFLITDRALKILKHFKPNDDFIVIPHWKTLDDKLDLVNNSKGIIILGGPGYQENMYPGVYKLCSNLDDIKVPIYPMGMGWKGFPGDAFTVKCYKFTDSSLKLLSKISSSVKYLSTRDHQTKLVLENAGIDNVLMSGCPVWYDLDSLNKDKRFLKIKKIVFTPAQDTKYKNQSVETMEILKEKYPNAIIYCSFHRGVGVVDEFTPKYDAKNTEFLSREAKRIGLEVVDVSYDLDKIDFYDECDFHVGYRVHAHIYFISKRMRSILIHEDGRGNGVSDALGTPGVNAYQRTKNSKKIELLSKKNIIAKFILKKANVVIKVSDITNELNEKLSIIENDFEIFTKSYRFIDSNFEVMREFVESIK